MNCEEAVRNLLDGKPDSPELKEHISRCQGCAALARQWRSLKSVKTQTPEEPPRITDLKICSAAIAKANEARRRRLFIRRTLIWSFAAAASIAVCVSAYLGLMLSSDPQRPGSLQVMAAPPASATPSSPSWDSIDLDEGLLNLSVQMEGTVATLSANSGTPDSQQQFNSLPDDFPGFDIEIPDFSS